jgi:hypothetical protein
MKSNPHIHHSLDRLFVALDKVRQLPDSTEKQDLLALLNEASDSVLCAGNELLQAQQKIEEMTHSIYAPALRAQYDFPSTNDYNAVREYVEMRKEQDPIFRRYCNSHTRKQLCERLSDEFGWIVDSQNFGRNINRH